MLNCGKSGRFLQLLVLFVFCGVCFGEVVGSVEMGGVKKFDCDGVCNSRSDQWRWLSVPMSRLVLNPAGSQYITDDLNSRLGMDVGYYVGDGAERLTDVINCKIVDSNSDSEVWNYSVNFAEEFGKEKSDWRTAGVIKEVDDGVGKITIADPNWKYTWGAMSMDVEPGFKCGGGKLRIKVVKADGWWSLKFKNGDGKDVVLQNTNHKTGTFVYDLEDFEGCVGSEKFNLGVFISHPKHGVWIESMDVELYSEARMSEVGEVKSKWYPHKIDYEVEYPKVSRKLSGCDFFNDENSIYRLIKAGKGKACRLEIAGAITGKHEMIDGVLVMGYDDFFYAVGFEEVAGGAAEYVKGGMSVDKWFWKLWIDLPDDGAMEMAVAVGFATKAEGKRKAIERVRKIIDDAAVRASLQRRKAKWDELMGKVPAPEKFGIEKVDSKGVTGADHKLFYYGAWAFTLMNVLPAMEENGYEYPQTPCGKPSLWNHGASKAKASAAWESFFAQQFLSFIMPEVAWDAFEGIMMQVDDDGWLNGECLPSRKAQTAWILYNNLPDKKRLAKVYEPMKRYLFWREKNPRWIYGNYDNKDEKTAHFVEQLLNDIDCMIKIAGVLGYDDEIEMWEERHKVNIENYRKWFFFDDGRDPADGYFVKAKSHRKGSSWSAVAGLHLRDLPDDLKKQLIKFYLKGHDASQPLVGASYCKYGDSSFQVYGLLEGGLEKQGWEVVNSLLRDQIIAGEFSEGYLQTKYKPTWVNWELDMSKEVAPGGVRPSYFGVGQMIDFTLMNNGVRIDGGKAVGIQNLEVRSQGSELGEGLESRIKNYEWRIKN